MCSSDLIDLFMLHRDDPTVSVATIMDTLNRLYDSGKIKCIGASNWELERIQEANAYAEKYNMVGFTSVSPHFGLAEQAEDPWGGNCVTLTGKDNQAARAYFQANQMPIFAYSALGRGFFSGKFRSDAWEDASNSLDEAGRKGYLNEGNMERLRRAEILANDLGVSVSQIALAWVFCQPLNTFALVGASSQKHLIANQKALALKLTPEQCQWLNLEVE